MEVDSHATGNIQLASDVSTPANTHLSDTTATRRTDAARDIHQRVGELYNLLKIGI